MRRVVWEGSYVAAEGQVYREEEEAVPALRVPTPRVHLRMLACAKYRGRGNK